MYLRSPVGHLDEQPAGPRDDEGQRVVGGDQVRLDGEAQQLQPIREIMLPDRLVPLEQVLAPPDVVDQDVERAALAADARDKCLHFAGDQMVDADRDRLAAELGDQRSGLLDRLAAPDLRRTALGAAPGHVDGRSGGAELDRDFASRSACSPRHQGDFSFKWPCHLRAPARGDKAR